MNTKLAIKSQCNSDAAGKLQEQYGYTKEQDSQGGSFFPDVDTGGGFFTIVTESLHLPSKYRFLVPKV